MTTVLLVLAIVLVLLIVASLYGAGPSRIRRRAVVVRPVHRRRGVHRPVRHRRVVG